VGKRKTSIRVLLVHIHSAYQQLQASLTILAQNTWSQEYRDNIGVAQKDLDQWRVDHWRHIFTNERADEESQFKK
jgi:hypothetical protein